MESALYGIYPLVVFVSEIERVSPANEWDFLYKNNECVNTVQSTFREVFSISRLVSLPDSNFDSHVTIIFEV